MNEFHPVAFKEGGSQKDEVARLGIGEDLSPDKVGIGVLQTAGKGQKSDGPEGFRHLLLGSFQLHVLSSFHDIISVHGFLVLLLVSCALPGNQYLAKISRIF